MIWFWDYDRIDILSSPFYRWEIWVLKILSESNNWWSWNLNPGLLTLNLGFLSLYHSIYCGSCIVEVFYHIKVRCDRLIIASGRESQSSTSHWKNKYLAFKPYSYMAHSVSSLLLNLMRNILKDNILTTRTE